MKTIKDKYLLVGADTAGFPIKEAVVAHLKAQGWTIEDIGVTDYERDKDDLNLMFHRVGLRVGAKIASGEYERAMVFCGTGMGILSDSDSLVLRPEFSTLAQARTRVSIYGLSGLPVTVGDTIASLDAPRIDLLRRIMPVVPVTPASLARAEIQTDCLVESVAEFARPWGTWEVRAFSNLDTNEARRVSFSASGRAVWDFWLDEQLRLDGDGAIKLEVPPCDTRVVRLTPFSAPRRNASFGFAAHSAGRIRAGVIPVRCARSIRRGEVSGRRNSESHASSAGKQGRDYILASLQTRRGCPAARTVAGVKRDCRMARCILKPKGMNVYELR